jgi:hypothetical protein
MSKKTTIVWLVLVVMLMTIMPNAYAHAYLDPGSGSLIIQLVVAGLLGLAVAGRLFWTNILVFLRLKERVELDDFDEDDDE